MIKLKDIIVEEFPKPVLDKIVAWKKSLQKGQLIVKEMGRVSQYDELYQYLGPVKNTDDYSNKGEENISAKLSKIGLVLFDHQFGLTIDLFSDPPLLNHRLVKLDANWRFLDKDEIEVLRAALKVHPQENVDMGMKVDDLRKETFREVIEAYNKYKIIMKPGNPL